MTYRIGMNSQLIITTKINEAENPKQRIINQPSNEIGIIHKKIILTTKNDEKGLLLLCVLGIL